MIEDEELYAWWKHEVEYTVDVMQSEWKEITAQSVAREVYDMYHPNSPPLDELVELCEDYLRRYSDPFHGIGYADESLIGLTEAGKRALFTAVTNKGKLLKAHADKLDAYIEATFGGDVFAD